ncbi:uncharacterized protein EV420DRAFT_1582695 [Desarmillaria tabescens]|uniref:F-box domain-containing protein n=1 Tax=Armillaria tabescens TaxID=1929756 RepID=A0AA39JC25_ARMTA|nr:uncharacterized protein EV420DRAFT_1582695 [Desarmillaria tabescens]KAK0439990.1 hypothetical protein EV420DRAFT_1582695 [Desarmillaria tabescens]
MDPSTVLPVESFDLSDGPWVLGRVNSAWRSVTVSSKFLWSTIVILDIPWLVRSGDAPLSITLSVHIKIAHHQRLSDSASRSLFSLLSTQSHRWQSMNLKAHTSIWEDFMQISHSPLHSLHAIVPDDSTLLQIPRICPNVVDLTLRVPKLANYRAFTVSPAHVEMPFLQHLDIKSHHIDFLEAITATRLRSLRFENFSGHSRSCSPLLRFIERSQCSNSLTELDLFWSCDCRDLVAMLSRASSPPYTNSNQRIVPSVLPNLRTLSFLNPEILCDTDVNLILDMVESRIVGQLRHVCLGLVDWDVMRKLKGRLSFLNAFPDVDVELRPALLAGGDYDGGKVVLIWS